MTAKVTRQKLKKDGGISWPQCAMGVHREMARTLGVRFKEHTDGKQPNSAVAKHTSAIGS